jgi:hypothetical protein
MPHTIVKKKDINKILFVNLRANMPDFNLSINELLNPGFNIIKKTIIGKTKPKGLKFQLLIKLP